ncbi:MAG: hypothetical protein Q8S36_07515 [Sulfuricurvum sp.]|nr:hypothetical protein [Sulfuricurvum sp.]
MARSSGIAIWSETIQADMYIHVNLWKIDKEDQKNCHFIDIGLLFKKANNKGCNKTIEEKNSSIDDIENNKTVEEKDSSTDDKTPCTSLPAESNQIKIYLPFAIKKDSVIDLYDKIITKNSIVDIFNKSTLKLKIDEKQSYTEIEGYLKEEEGSLFVSSSKIKIDSIEDNVVHITPIHSMEDNFYIRMRVNLDTITVEQFSQIHHPKTSFLLPSFKEIEHVSFSINERRGLPPTPSYGIANSGLTIKRVDFFLVRESAAEILSQHSPFKRCRELEHNLWHSYLPDKAKDFDRKLAYHWQEGNGEKTIEHFGAFAKFSYNADGIKVIIIYTITVILLGAIAGSVGNLISVSSDVGQIIDGNFSSIIKNKVAGIILAMIALAIVVMPLTQINRLKDFAKKMCRRLK